MGTISINQAIKENNLFNKLGIVHDPNGLIHQVDLFLALVKRVEALERKLNV